MQYNIKKGKFSSGIHLGINFGRVSQTYKVRFDSSCLYDDIDWERDWNKLIGWSFTNLPVERKTEYSAGVDFEFNGKQYIWGHHFNSIRFVWRANKKNGTIEIALYYYMDGLRAIIELCEVPINQEVCLSIVLKDEFATVVVVCKESNISYVKPITLSHAFKAIWSYRLFPYFGGNNPAPQDISLNVTDV